MGKGLLIGLAAGFLAGWLVFGLARESAPAPRRTAEASAPASEPPSPAAEPAPSAPESTQDFFLRNAPIEELQPYLLARELPFGGEALPALAARLQTARTAKDWELFRTIVGLISKLKTPAAQEKLVAVMGDRALGFRDPLGSLFSSALGDSDVDGIADAARRRFEIARARKGPRHDLQCWLALVATHGDRADLEWLEQLRGDRDLGRDVLEAYREGSANEIVARRLVRLYREDATVGARAVDLLWRCPAVGFDFYRAEIQNSDQRSKSDFLRAFGRCVTADRLADAKRFLLDMQEPHLRVQAVYAVQQLQRQGLDVSGLEPLIRAPVDELERLGREGTDADASWTYRPMYAVLYNRVAWSERAVHALEAAARRVPRRREDLLEAAQRIRAEIEDDDQWRTR